ncbi:MAG TPA: PAS domain S-box protein [Anaeromyxobacteraceae bacterium]|nr:PAS domain S-box protein [Anaeromyxobacteraceae bacterium]
MRPARPARPKARREGAAKGARRQESRLRHLLSLSPSVVYSLRLGPDGPSLATVSENVERVLGWSSSDVAHPGAWAEKVHPDDRAAAVAGRARALTEGQVIQEYRFRHRDGSWRWIRDQLRRVRDEGGRPAVVGALSDVTEQRRVEQRLRESDERFRALIERSTELIIVFDRRGAISFASPSSADVLGFAPEDLVGTSHLGWVHPDDAPRVAAEFLALAKLPGVSRRTAFRVRHRDGRWRHLEAEARNLLHLPAVAGIVTNSRDVTEQRRFEEQVHQTQRLESVGRLAGGVAHDFNNLLVAILGYAEFLEQDIRAGHPSLEDVAEIRSAGERARDLTLQLLAVARRQMVAPRVIDLNEVIRDAERLLRRVLGEDVDLAVAPAPGLWRVKADPAQIQQVVLNLAVNARDAMPRGGKLTLETANVELDERYAGTHPGVRPGPHVLLALSDTGVGLSPEARAHLFEPFFTTKPTGHGTGLGLATVYGIVRQAGGHVWVYSEQGHGTSVKVYLPRCEEAAPAPAPRPAPRDHRGSETVLVAEDAPAVRELAARALSEAGYQVLQAGGGKEALEMAARAAGPVHLLLTDVVMPDMSGRELAEALGRLRPETRVLYMSGYTENTITHHGVLDPGVHFLAKPFTPSALLARAREVLDAP